MCGTEIGDHPIYGLQDLMSPARTLNVGYEIGAQSVLCVSSYCTRIPSIEEYERIPENCKIISDTTQANL
jgi:hypothetical protein